MAKYLAFYYAGIISSNPIENTPLEELKKLIVTKQQKFFGRRIYNLTFEWENFRLRERDLSSKPMLTERLNGILGPPPAKAQL